MDLYHSIILQSRYGTVLSSAGAGAILCLVTLLVALILSLNAHSWYHIVPHSSFHIVPHSSQLGFAPSLSQLMVRSSFNWNVGSPSFARFSELDKQVQ
jgi:hypothetical protein